MPIPGVGIQKGKIQMKKIMFAALAVAFAAGCRVVEVENYGEEIARDADDKPVLLADGRIQTVKKGWSVYHYQHWMLTEADKIAATVKPDEITFDMNGLNSRPDGTNLVALINTSFTGVNTLAAKIIAACVTSGGSVGAEAAAEIGRTLYQKFIAAGGKEDAAKVFTDKNTVTVTDGTVTCTECTDGNCSECTVK